MSWVISKHGAGKPGPQWSQKKKWFRQHQKKLTTKSCEKKLSQNFYNRQFSLSLIWCLLCLIHTVFYHQSIVCNMAVYYTIRIWQMDESGSYNWKKKWWLKYISCLLKYLSWQTLPFSNTFVCKEMLWHIKATLLGQCRHMQFQWKCTEVRYLFHNHRYHALYHTNYIPTIIYIWFMLCCACPNTSGATCSIWVNSVIWIL